MKLVVTQANLSHALNTVARVATNRGTLPILANVLLRAENNRLSIAATNLDIATTHFVGSKIDTEGAITVPARLMQDFITSLPDNVINLEVTDNKLKINTDQYQSTINGIPADDFPVMPAISGTSVWKIPADQLKRTLSQVVFAASADDARPVLGGVYFHAAAGTVTVVATDSYRLAEAKMGKTKNQLDFLLPASAAADLLRIIDETTPEVSVTHDEQQVQFAAGDITLVARLIEGHFPDYHKLIPSKFATVAKLSRNEFINITKVSSLFARESAGSITLRADADNGQISINAVASQVGENTAAANAEISAPGEVTLNSRYLVEALNAFTTENIEFCFNGKLEPCILKSSDDTGYLHLIMPLRS